MKDNWHGIGCWGIGYGRIGCFALVLWLPTIRAAEPTTPPPHIDPQLELPVLQLVRVHLPEIEQVLDRLRDHNRVEYQQAIRDLAKSVRRLEQAKKRDEALFEVELQILKARSTVNLLTARLKVRDDETARQSLRAAAATLQRAELARDEYDIRMLEERIAQSQTQLTVLKQRVADKQAAFEIQLNKDYANYLRKAGRGARNIPKRNNK